MIYIFNINSTKEAEKNAQLAVDIAQKIFKEKRMADVSIA